MTEYSVTLNVPATAPEVAALQKTAEAELLAWANFTIDTPEEYAAVDATLSEVVRRKDAATAMRQRATGPLYKATKEIESWFAPVLRALTALESKLKGGMSAYRIAQETRAREARELAAKAADAGDSGALTEALTTAIEAATPPAGRASVGFEWRIHRIADDLVPDEWWSVDTKRIEAHAKAHKGDDPPIIPGVVFERFAKIGARR